MDIIHALYYIWWAIQRMVHVTLEQSVCNNQNHDMSHFFMKEIKPCGWIHDQMDCQMTFNSSSKSATKVPKKTLKSPMILIWARWVHKSWRWTFHETQFLATTWISLTHHWSILDCYLRSNGIFLWGHWFNVAYLWQSAPAHQTQPYFDSGILSLTF